MMQDQQSLLEGKVAGILSEQELVINLGARDGVTKGMEFAVLAATPLEFSDPDTGELLTVVDRPKVYVRVTKVDEKASICRTYKTRRVGGGLFGSTSALFSAPSTVRETLKTEDSTLPPPLDEDESYVKIGDRVREVERDPEASGESE